MNNADRDLQGKIVLALLSAILSAALTLGGIFITWREHVVRLMVIVEHLDKQQQGAAAEMKFRRELNDKRFLELERRLANLEASVHNRIAKP